MNIMTGEKALAKNTILQVGGKLISNVLGFVTFMFLARYLGAAGYGELSIILTFLSIFAVIVDFGLTLTTTQMISEKGADEQKIIGNLLTLRFISAFLFLGSAPIIALFFPYDRMIVLGIAVGTLSYFFATSAQMMIGVFQKRLIIGQAVLAEIMNRAIVLAGIALVPIFQLSIIHVVLILIVGNAIQFFTVLSFTRRLIPFSLQADLTLWKNIIHRSWPIGASIFFNLIYMKGDIIFLSLHRSDTEIGLYSAAYKIVDVVTAIPVMFMGLVLPMLVAYWSKNKAEEHNKLLQKAFDFFSLFAIPFVFGSILTAVPLMEFIGDTEYREAGEVLKILGPTTSVVFFGTLFGHAIVGIQKQKQMVTGYFAVAVFTVIGYLLFIPAHGMWAAAWLTLGSEILITSITAAVVLAISGFRPKFRHFANALLASLVMAAALLLLPALHVLLIVMIGIAIYAFVLFLLGSFHPRQLTDLFLPEKPPISQA